MAGTGAGMTTRPQRLWEHLGLPDLRAERRIGLRTLTPPGWQPGHTPLPTICPPLTTREIEFLKKETAQRRVLEESELARKEEMDKLLDKVGPGCPGGGHGREAPIWHPLGTSVMLLAESSGPCPTSGHKEWGPCRVPRPDPRSPFVFQISELEGNLQTLRNSNST